MEKYLLCVDEKKIALRFNPRMRAVTIGGNKKFRVVIEEIISSVFDSHGIVPSFPQRNKLRYNFRVPHKFDYNRALRILEKQGIIVISVTNLGKVMR